MKRGWVALVLAGCIGLVAGFALRPAVAREHAPTPPTAPPGYVIDVAEGNPTIWHNALNAAALVHAAYPSARIAVVAHGSGIRMLLASSAVAPGLESLVRGGGVELDACANSMATYGITAGQLVGGARVVPSGVVEVARREADGYLYLNAA